MAGLMATDAQLALAGSGASTGKLEEPDHSSSNWFFSRDEIEKQSPSRMDGIDLKKETYFRKSYCTFLQDLGMCLKVPQVTIATAIVFCHRFFLRQSHFKNDRHMIATICMFLAGKVEETPRPLRDVILTSYEIRHKKDPSAVGRIKQKEVYEEQKELVLVGERLVLTTLGFDLNIHHPYKPLVAAIKKFKVAQNALAQVAWNFVNDGLRTSLCLQFKPHHIAAGAIFLAAKFLKVKLPSDGEKVWWQEFEVTPRQLEEVSNQMLELYETVGPGGGPNGSRLDPGSSNGLVNRLKGLEAMPTSNGHHWNHNSSNAVGTDKIEKHAPAAKTDDSALSSRREDVYEVSASHVPPVYEKQENGHMETEYEPGHENGSTYVSTDVPIDNVRSKPVLNGVSKLVVKQESKELLATPLEEGQIKEELREKKPTDVRIKSDSGTALRKPRVKVETEDRRPNLTEGSATRDVTETKSSVEEKEVDGSVDSKPLIAVKVESVKVKPENEDEEPKKPWVTTIEDVDTDRVKALAQKRRKSRGEGLESKPAAVKVEPTDEEELLERELESGVEAAAEAERVKQERRDVKQKAVHKSEYDGVEVKKDRPEDGELGSKRRRYSEEEDGETVSKRRKDDGVNEKKWAKGNERDRHEWADGDSDRSRAVGVSTDRAEDGELPSTSHVHEQTRSPRQQDRRPLPSLGTHEKNGSPLAKRHRDSHLRSRDGHRDNRGGHNSRERDYHQRDHHHQHRPDGDRDRHHHKDRLSRPRS